MTYDILATGSGGNAVVVNGKILIDIGVPFRTLEKSGCIGNLNLVLLTHRHSDHFNPATVRALHRERPAVRWVCCEWMAPLLMEAGVDRRVIDIANPYEENDTAFLYKDTGVVHSEFLPHDVPNCAWHVFDGKEDMIYATDTGSLDGITAKNYGLYLIEANYTQAELARRMAEKQARGEFSYEYRAEKYHLSREQAERWLSENAGPKSKYEFLHQHKDDTPEAGKQ